MSLGGSCRCNNIEVRWHTVDYSVVPRACQCDYCRAKGAAWVSKSGTAVDAIIHKGNLHRIITQGSGVARFHECGACGDLVFVTAEFDGETYGALNAACLENKLGFSTPVAADFSNDMAGQKRERWRQNWCHPVRIN